MPATSTRTPCRPPSEPVRTRTHARIWGSRGTLPLPLKIDFVHDGSA